MTHEERYERRKLMARYVRENGKSWEAVAEAARDFGVSGNTVSAACREFGVRLVRSLHPFGEDTFVILAEIITTDDALTAISERHGVTQQYVAELYSRCRKAGIPVPVRKPGVARNG